MLDRLLKILSSQGVLETDDFDANPFIEDVRPNKAVVCPDVIPAWVMQQSKQAS